MLISYGEESQRPEVAYDSSVDSALPLRVGETGGPRESERLEESDDEDPEQRQLLERIRPLAQPGAVFRLNERDIGRYMKLGNRMVVVVGPLPSLTGLATEVLSREVRVSTRRSWKPELFDLPRSEEDEYRIYVEENVVFTRRKLIDEFTLDGFFELDVRLPVPIRLLNPKYFLDWLPRPYIDLIVSGMQGQPLPRIYPPRA